MFGSGPMHLKLPLHLINNTVRALTDAACTQTHPSVAGILKSAIPERNTLQAHTAEEHNNK